MSILIMLMQLTKPQIIKTTKIMTTKLKTNITMVKDLLKELNGFELALLRERVMTIMDITKQSIENNPSQWENSIVHPSLYMGLYDKVQKHIGFNEN